MTTATTPNLPAAAVELVLCIAFELGASKWKMAFSTGLGQQLRYREAPAADLEAVQLEVDHAKARFGAVPVRWTVNGFRDKRESYPCGAAESRLRIARSSSVWKTRLPALTRPHAPAERRRKGRWSGRSGTSAATSSMRGAS
jgi:hypothetical protein